MGQVYIWDEETKSVLPREEVWARRAQGQFGQGGTIIKDIEPYVNVIDGKPIMGRKQHRDFLRARNMVEVGNEKVKTPEYTPAPHLDRDMKRAWDAVSSGDMSHARPKFTQKEFERG